MTDAPAAAGPDSAADHHDDHGTGSAHDDDHGMGHEHDEEQLGPIDIVAWGAGLLGVLVGGVTALAFVLSTGRL